MVILFLGLDANDLNIVILDLDACDKTNYGTSIALDSCFKKEIQELEIKRYFMKNSLTSVVEELAPAENRNV